MTIIKDSQLTDALQVIETSFNEGMKNASGEVNSYTSDYRGLESLDVTHALSLNSAEWRDWEDEKVFNNIKEASIRVSAKQKELSYRIPALDIKYRKLPMHINNIRDLGQDAGSLKDQLATKAIEDNAVGYDGLAYFHASHMLSGTTQSNLLTSKPLNAANLETAYLALAGFKGPGGRPLKPVTAVDLIVPKALEITAKRLVATEFDGYGASNPLFGMAKVVVNSRLTSSTTWYLANVSNATKPVGYLVVEDAHLVIMDQAKDHSRFYFNAVDISGEAVVGAYLTMWHLMVKCTA